MIEREGRAQILVRSRPSIGFCCQTRIRSLIKTIKQANMACRLAIALLLAANVHEPRRIHLQVLPQEQIAVASPFAERDATASGSNARAPSQAAALGGYKLKEEPVVCPRSAPASADESDAVSLVRGSRIAQASTRPSKRSRSRSSRRSVEIKFQVRPRRKRDRAGRTTTTSPASRACSTRPRAASRTR